MATYRLYNSVLNPEFWDSEKKLNPEISSKLLNIARTFYKETELGAPLKDVQLLGSSAGYNWTPTSDLDLHVIIDFKKIDEDVDLVKKLVDGLKFVWNQSHNLSIGKHPIEVYIQDVNEVNRSQSIYSLMKNKWVKEPKHENVKIDKDKIKKKFKEFKDLITITTGHMNLQMVTRLLKRLRDMRNAGLDKAGEYSTENLVYKLLRAAGHLDTLHKKSLEIKDKELTV
jgi:predicted nucleotidyltransferase